MFDSPAGQFSLDVGPVRVVAIVAVVVTVVVVVAAHQPRDHQGEAIIQERS